MQKLCSIFWLPTTEFRELDNSRQQMIIHTFVKETQPVVMEKREKHTAKCIYRLQLLDMRVLQEHAVTKDPGDKFLSFFKYRLQKMPLISIQNEKFKKQIGFLCVWIPRKENAHSHVQPSSSPM